MLKKLVFLAQNLLSNLLEAWSIYQIIRQPKVTLSSQPKLFDNPALF